MYVLVSGETVDTCDGLTAQKARTGSHTIEVPGWPQVAEFKRPAQVYVNICSKHLWQCLDGRVIALLVISILMKTPEI